MTNLSDTARVILSRAAQHEMGLAFPTDTLKGGALAKVADSLLKQKLVIAIAPSSRMAHASDDSSATNARPSAANSSSVRTRARGRKLIRSLMQ